MNYTRNHKVLIHLIFLPLVFILLLVSPLAQNMAYHNFADQIKIIGISNFHNVFSNILFFILPVIGMKQYFELKQNNPSWLVFLIGIFLVGPGSAFYHYHPTNFTLIWDRLPMTIAFMGLISFILVEVYQIKNEKRFLGLLLLVGFYSILHWVAFKDLRVYYWVQLSPFLGIIFVAIKLPTPTLKPKYLAFGIFFYALAKVTEAKDFQIYETLGYSGHSIKHLLAGFAVFALMAMRSPQEKESIQQ